MPYYVLFPVNVAHGMEPHAIGALPPPPPQKNGGEEAAARGLPPPLAPSTRMITGDVNRNMSGGRAVRGRRSVGDAVCVGDEMDAVDLVGPWGRRRRMDLMRIGRAGGPSVDGIGGLHSDDCATDGRTGEGLVSHCGGYRDLGFVILLAYLIWVVSAFIAFSEDYLWEGPPRRAPKRRRLRRRRASRSLAYGHGTSEKEGAGAWIAVAPPIVGRRRLCRARPLRGRVWAIRLGGKRIPGRGRRLRRLRLCAPCAWPPPRRRSAKARGHGSATTGDGRPDDVACRHRTAADACKDALGTLTVGQAGNPGPPGPLQWLSSMAASAVAYARPGKAGFYGLRAAGYLDMECPPHSPFVLKLATANTTGWRPLQDFLTSTNANVVFAQEHR